MLTLTREQEAPTNEVITSTKSALFEMSKNLQVRTETRLSTFFIYFESCELNYILLGEKIKCI